jgi:hypothetical protein
MATKYNSHSSFKRIVRGRPIDIDRKIRLNKMYYDDNRTIRDIICEMKIGQTTVDREIFTTRDEWERFKQCNES